MPQHGLRLLPRFVQCLLALPVEPLQLTHAVGIQLGLAHGLVRFVFLELVQQLRDEFHRRLQLHLLHNLALQHIRVRQGIHRFNSASLLLHQQVKITVALSPGKVPVQVVQV
ncbi:hypothetical protein D3C75_619730 [compost metagenome]